MAFFFGGLRTKIVLWENADVLLLVKMTLFFRMNLPGKNLNNPHAILTKLYTLSMMQSNAKPKYALK